MDRDIARIAEGGRIVIPARMRKALGVDKGDALWLELVDGELRVRAARSALRRIQEQLGAESPKRSPAEALVIDRRIEAVRG